MPPVRDVSTSAEKRLKTEKITKPMRGNRTLKRKKEKGRQVVDPMGRSTLLP